MKKSKTSLDLFRVAPTLVPEPAPLPDPIPDEAPLGEIESVSDLDDYDDSHHLHLVDPPRPSPSVIVELVDGHFEVSRLRDNGTTVANVRWTRAELEELQRRITAALEMK